MIGTKKKQQPKALPIRYVETTIISMDDRLSSITFGRRKKKRTTDKHNSLPKQLKQTDCSASKQMWQKMKAGCTQTGNKDCSPLGGVGPKNLRYSDSTFPTIITQHEGDFVSKLEWSSSLSSSSLWFSKYALEAKRETETYMYTS